MPGSPIASGRCTSARVICRPTHAMGFPWHRIARAVGESRSRPDAEGQSAPPGVRPDAWRRIQSAPLDQIAVPSRCVPVSNRRRLLEPAVRIVGIGPAQLNKFSRALEIAKEPGEILTVEAQIDGLEHALRQAGFDIEVVRPINELKVWARWKLGRALAKVERGSGPGRGKKKDEAQPSFAAFINAIGLDKARAIAPVAHRGSRRPPGLFRRSTLIRVSFRPVCLFEKRRPSLRSLATPYVVRISTGCHVRSSGGLGREPRGPQ